ncbi:MAG: AAA family ATPase [Candidatus Cloacimonetes bacterium]|jgi:magnesium chelatase subunit I|nr:AAA family ATPase [Candidatus Cloacimonadota bacterium]
MKKIYFPFTAIVGQEELLLGIILNIINPKLGGLLIKGVKGSGKSTSVYSMTDIIPEIEVMNDCKFNCNPQQPEYWCEGCRNSNSTEKVKNISMKVANIPVPLSITEDRLLGNVDVELLLKEGKQRFIPGLLAKAHRQILYIDEVNLLPDHIVDDILDVSSMGWNHIEREGFSVSHPSEFLLIGTMNPEEGELRPQILDRFPLSVEVASVTNEAYRREIINRNLAYEKNPSEFRKQFLQETENLKNLIILSRTLLEKVEVKSEFYDIVVNFCADKKVDGHRADIGIIKTARTHAAFEMKLLVELRHIKQAAKFVLGHRTREGGLSKPLTEEEIDIFFDNLKKEDFIKETDRSIGIINKEINLFSEGGLIQQEKK